MKQRIFIALGIGLLCALLVTLLYLLGLFAPVDEALSDSFFRLRAPGGRPDPRITIVDIDDASVRPQALGPVSNWPASYHSRVWQTLRQQGALSIGMHFIPHARNPQEEKQLAIALKANSPILLPLVYHYEENLPILPSRVLEKAASSVALISYVPTHDGIMRSVDARLKAMGQTYWALPIEMMRQAYKAPPPRIHNGQLLLGENRYTLAADEKLLVNYLKPQAGRYAKHTHISFAHVLKGNYPPDFFRDKLVLLTVSAAGLGNDFYTPISPYPAPSVYLQATLLDNLLNHRTLRPFPMLGLLLLLFASSAGLSALFNRYIGSSLRKQFLCLLLASAGIVALAFLLFEAGYFRLEVMPFLSAYLLIYACLLAYTIARSNLLLGSQLLAMSSLYRLPDEFELYKHDLTGALNVFKHVSMADFVLFRRYSEGQLTWGACLPEQRLEWEAAPVSQELLKNLPERLQPLVDIPPVIRLPLEPAIRYHVIILSLRQGDTLIGMLEFYFSGPQGQRFNHLLARDLAEQFQQRLCQPKRVLIPKNILLLGPTYKIELLAQLTQHIQREREFFETVLLSSHVGVMVCDPLGYILFNNNRFTDIIRGTGILTFERSNVVLLMEDVFPAIQGKWEYFWESVIHNREQAETELHFDNKIYRFTLTPVLSHGEIKGMIGMLNDITELRLEAITDGLTLLNNREYFNSSFQAEVDRAQRIKSYFFTLLIFDIDHFKRFNDTYGHQAGDRVLRAVGQTVRETFRKTDIVTRYGGEEFAVILPDTGPVGAAIISDRLGKRVSKLEVNDHHGVALPPVTISGGIALFEEGDHHAEALFERADRALYASKEAGRNCLHYFDRDKDAMLPVTNGKIQKSEKIV